MTWRRLLLILLAIIVVFSRLSTFIVLCLMILVIGGMRLCWRRCGMVLGRVMRLLRTVIVWL